MSQLITTSFNADGFTVARSLVLLAVFSPSRAGPNPACLVPDKGEYEFITRIPLTWINYADVAIGFSAARARTPQVAMASRSKLWPRDADLEIGPVHAARISANGPKMRFHGGPANRGNRRLVRIPTRHAEGLKCAESGRRPDVDRTGQTDPNGRRVGRIC